MSLKTIGTHLYTIDPADSSILKVGKVTAIEGIDTPIDQIEDTDFDHDARTYVSGLKTPGAATFTINFDPADASHVRLHELKTAGTTLQWALGCGDGTAPPTYNAVGGGFTLPATRTWLDFEGYMNAYPFGFALNAVVTSTVGIQVSGDVKLTPKV